MYTVQVANGMKLLDRVLPGWTNKVDLDVLDVSRGDTCVIGQLYGKFSKGRYELRNEIDTDTDDFGFNLPLTLLGMPNEITDAEYQVLTETWKQEITARRDLMAEMEDLMDDSADRMEREAVFA